jgi:hypothetical protein
MLPKSTRRPTTILQKRAHTHKNDMSYLQNDYNVNDQQATTVSMNYRYTNKVYASLVHDVVVSS